MSDTQYSIRVRGRLPERWAPRFAPLSLRVEPDGTTLLRGPLPDQVALHGTLGRLRDLGVELVSVECPVRGREPAP